VTVSGLFRQPLTPVPSPRTIRDTRLSIAEFREAAAMSTFGNPPPLADVHPGEGRAANLSSIGVVFKLWQVLVGIGGKRMQYQRRRPCSGEGSHALFDESPRPDQIHDGDAHGRAPIPFAVCLRAAL
jgi:hypothetical protein